MNPNMMQMNQARMNDITRAANRARMARRATLRQVGLWHKLIRQLGRGMVQSGEYLLTASETSRATRQTATCSAARPA